MEDIEFAPVRTQPLGPIYRIGGVRAPTKSLLRLKGETCPQVDGSNACARKEKRRDVTNNSNGSRRSHGSGVLVPGLG